MCPGRRTRHLPTLGFRLEWIDGRLCVVPEDGSGPVCVDFASAKAEHRRQRGGGVGQALARAVGLKRGRRPRVLDATAGLGRDAWVLASLGCTVELVEQNELLAALLEDGLARAGADEELATIVTRMSLWTGEAGARMRSLPPADYPDTVYLDPMYPESGKSALPKKEMQLVRSVVTEQADDRALLESALRCARERVVVKRPRRADPLPGPTPTTEIVSAHTRFDVYLTPLVRGEEPVE